MSTSIGLSTKICPKLFYYSECRRYISGRSLRGACYFLTQRHTVDNAAVFALPRFASVSSFHSCSVQLHKTEINPEQAHTPNRKVSLPDGPSLKDFLSNSVENSESAGHEDEFEDEIIPYLTRSDYGGSNRKVYFETYGCQMNENDTDIAWSILKSNGYQRTTNVQESDVILVMTCAIREGAEQKIWSRLEYFKSLKRSREKRSLGPIKIGILGCMAERLKTQIVEKEKSVDLVCGPDAYKDLPRMLSVTESGQKAVNVLLSLDETYADVVPVRLNTGSPSAFVSIMRGCDNMCSYCIVPFTRGRERSRPIESILDEIRQLSDQGVKEIMLLGQNVNSYRDTSSVDNHSTPDQPGVMSKGFQTVYKPKTGGRRFGDLLDQASLINPEMRFRFTSPHPKDFPDEVLQLIRERPNICNQLHIPAQSGSSTVLESMRRGYTRESYLELVDHIREIIPDVSLSSDFIAGFCGESETDHEQTVDLIRRVKYNFAFCFPYSMRGKTRAYHRLKDDVPDDVKNRRHQELVTVFREEAEALNRAQIGQRQLVLIEGVSKRSEKELVGRNDGNTKVIVPMAELPVDNEADVSRPMNPGDYVVVQIHEASSQVLKGTALCHSSIANFSRHTPTNQRMSLSTAGN